MSAQDGFTLSFHEDRRALLALVREHLEAHEGENALLLGFLENNPPSPRAEPLLLAHLHDGGHPIAVAYMTAVNLILSRGIHLGAERLVDALLERKLDPPGLVGPDEEVEHLADAWTGARGCARGPAVEQMLYELRTVVHPTGVEGRMRPMSEGDVELVAEWGLGFHREALPHEPHTAQDARENALARPRHGLTYLWEREGTPVAMAALARSTRRGITVNAVYTPPEQRGRGHASALVAALSEEGLRRGKEFCVLYTDLANPTSNAIYQRIGYRPIARSKMLRLRYA